MIMSRIRGKDTKIELKLRRELHNRGIRYRKNVKDIYGRPDIAIKKYKIAIFCDGDFWHGYDWEDRRGRIKTNTDFWIKKIERNIEKDVEVNHVLKHMGYTVIRIWEHDIDNNVKAVADMIEREINSKKDYRIQIAEKEDLDECLNLYGLVCAEMKDTDHDILWEVGSHPTREELFNEIGKRHLYIIKDKNTVIAAVVLNHNGTVNYEKANWKVNVTHDKAIVLHLLAVDPKHRGMGLARKMVQFGIMKAKDEGMNAFRLDVIKHNKPALSLYKSLGFLIVDEYTETINNKETRFLILEKSLNPIET